MDKAVRNLIARTTQAARRLLEDEYSEQLEGTFDILPDGTIQKEPGVHLAPDERLVRDKLVAVIEHKRAAGMAHEESVGAYLREAAFTTLNRFVGLKMAEARGIVQECVSKGDQSAGFKEFSGLAPGMVALPDQGYRMFLECLFDELSCELGVLFDRRDPASLLWPRRKGLENLLELLNDDDLMGVWAEDETIGWVYQYFNGDEERTKMRAESQAPSNSRELAVRNQFFTPRYVVQFLTDNTLGRIWWEMMKGETKLADLDYLVRRPKEVFLADGESPPASDVDDSELTQEELIQQTVYVPFRAKKDPRDLRILDPACGSGHFLLYAFVLLVLIYEEAWRDAEAAAFTETGTQLRTDYGSLEELRRATPELILRHNLHGVDIDPRAAQIAALALWMCAQRAYNQFEVDRAHRPPITRTNIVVAEPMPGDAELVEEFAASLKPAVLSGLFKKMVDEMTLAGELGSLLKIEQSIATVVKDAEEAHRQEGLFAEKIGSQDFWGTADEEIIAALGSFTESAAGSVGVRRQLFSEDAVQGVAFIELMRKRFDVVLMNPPFGSTSKGSKQYFDERYGPSKVDLYAGFVNAALVRSISAGKIGCISPRSFLYQIDFVAFRNWAIPHIAFACIVELGFGELDNASNRTAAYVYGHRERSDVMPTLYADLSSSIDRAQDLLNISSGLSHWILANTREFEGSSTRQFLFKLPKKVRDKLANLNPLDPVLGKSHRGDRAGPISIVNGLQCPSDFRYVRLGCEVDPRAVGTRWHAFLKPCGFMPYVSELACVVNWLDGGKEQKAEYEVRGISPSKYISGESFYPSIGVWWPDVSERGIAASLIPYPAIPGRKAILGVGKPDSGVSADVLAGHLNSILCEGLLGLLTPERHHKPSYMGQLPWVGDTNYTKRASSHYRLMAKLLAEESPSETSPFFDAPLVLRANAPNFNAAVKDYRKALEDATKAARQELTQFDSDSLSVLGVDVDGGALLTEMSQRKPIEDWFPSEVEMNIGFKAHVAFDMFSYLVGCAVGRWDIRKTGALEKRRIAQIQRLPPLPAGALIDGEGCTAKKPPPGYPIQFPSLGIFVDDRGHQMDLILAIGHVAKAVWGGEAEAWLDGISVALAGGEQRLREFCRTKFFPEHLKRYTRSRRKAPIYWQLATPTVSYSVWCYYHRLTRDTFFRIANDYVTPKVEHEERKLDSSRQEAGPDPSSKQRMAIDAQETFVTELRSFATEVDRIKPLWNPNLNDGVIINFAPLWRLVPQYKAWQKECKTAWDKVAKGDYDWAHLAMHLWPERVVPKCATDRSLAIAHDLEEEFWKKNANGKWAKKKVSKERIEALIKERTSPTVKAALNDLLSAPAPAGMTKGKRKRSTRKKRTQ